MGENIYKRKDGRYEGRYFLGIDEKGKRKYKSVYAKTKKEVKSRLAEVEKQMRGQNEKSALNLPFEQAALRWLETKSAYRATTLSTYKDIVKSYLIPNFKEYTISQIDLEAKQSYINEMERRGYAELSIKAHIQILEKIVDFYFGKKELEYKDRISNKTSPEILSDKEWEELKEHIKTNPNNAEIGIACICYLGIRVGELCALQWKNVNFELRTILVQKEIQRVKSSEGENKATRLAVMEIEPRIIPIPDVLYDILLSTKAKKDNHYILTGSAKPAEPRNFQFILNSVAKRIGIINISPKVLRNTFSVNALKLGFNAKILADILGVKTNVIIKYLELVPADPFTEIQKIK